MDRPIFVAALGSGGMADVFLAMRRGMAGFAKLVVIKRLRPTGLDGDEVALFHDEARISARLNHPNVVQTHEVGFDGEHYRLEMEYLDGQPLHRIVHRARQAGRDVTIATALAVVHDVLAGLHYAHELADYDGSPLGIVHRDVSPQNVFLTYEGRVKVVDFGIAKAAGQEAVTRIGMVKGKCRYMAPEQAIGGLVDRRADVFAAGIVLWELLTGERYWGKSEEIVVFRRLSMGDLSPSPRMLRPDVPADVDAVCGRALAFDPADRFATAGEFLHALEECAAFEGATRPLAELTAELFVEERAQIKVEIERAAKRPSETQRAFLAAGPTTGAALSRSPQDQPTKLTPLEGFEPAQPSPSARALAITTPIVRIPDFRGKTPILPVFAVAFVIAAGLVSVRSMIEVPVLRGGAIRVPPVMISLEDPKPLPPPVPQPAARDAPSTPPVQLVRHVSMPTKVITAATPPVVTPPTPPEEHHHGLRLIREDPYADAGVKR